MNAKNLRSGYRGEQSLDFLLSFLPEQEFLIFHYIRIPDKQGHFQIDILLLSLKFFLIIEVKNIYDNMHFDGMGQAIRYKNNEIEVFTNPLDQVNLQHRRLLEWLRKHDFPPIPIEKIVVYSQDDTFLKNIINDPIISEIVMHKEKVLPKIEKLTDTHTTYCFDEDQLIELSYRLLEEHESEKFEGMKRNNISAEDLLKGVFCSDCGTVPMKSKAGKWRCISCGAVSRTAHRQELADYALLIKEYINNREAREFLQIGSGSITRKLLQKEDFEKVGKGSGMRYKINVERLIE
ncbi:NERD domain-containing protein [Virgibacillus sp. L01]|uniref:NERD domain-containing protein n=1 Tax=Virgibacillus sp. L01 TaxID=3457429 RepID=UPI003FCFC4F7